MLRYRFLLLFCLGVASAFAQQEPLEKKRPPYDRKEEIIYDGKRYRIHNSYLSLGGGYIQSSIRSQLQKTIGVDYQFPIRRLHFQIGGMMSGNEFASNNNVQAHLGWGLRKEKRSSNLALYAGPSFYTGVEGDASGKPRFYQGVGAYFSAQAVTKFTYDIGLGIEFFGEISPKQSILGLKIIAFFSGAYRGVKKNFNPNVRSENPK